MYNPSQIFIVIMILPLWEKYAWMCLLKLHFVYSLLDQLFWNAFISIGTIFYCAFINNS